jgi:hypothetical protein
MIAHMLIVSMFIILFTSSFYRRCKKWSRGLGYKSMFIMSYCRLSCYQLLPVGEKNSTLPPYLHLTVNQKLIAAYILGKLY